MKLVFATNNKHKFEEVKSSLPPTIELLSLANIGFNEDIEETESTIEGNALLKAKTIYTKTGYNCFADDSGLCVDVLNGAPGVYSARYAGEPKNDEANIDKLLLELKDVTNRKAHFKTVIALVINNQSHSFEGKIHGTIITERQGTEGFGYDAVFMPDGYNQTFAQISFNEKTKISHRALALKQMNELLKNSILFNH